MPVLYQSAVFITSVPLAAKVWRPLAEREVIAARAGETLVNPLQVSNLSGGAAIPND